MSSNFEHDIAIIGIGLRLPNADNQFEFWDILKNGVECIDDFPISRQRDVEEFLFRKLNKLGNEKLFYEYGAYLDEIDKFACNKFKIQQEEARLMDPSQRLFLEIAYETMEDAGYTGERFVDKSVGVYIGYNSKFSRDYFDMVSEFEIESKSVAYIGNLPSIIPSRISYFLDLKGPTLLIDTACSSGLVALHTAMLGIRNGDCNAAIVGGITINMFPLKEDSEKIGVDSSDGRARTFDVKSDGTGWGEGVVAIMIRPLDAALASGDNVYAVIKGSAINQDGYSMGITIPNMDAQTEVIKKVWEESNVDPETISYIEAHGTGTHIGDPVEIEAIKNAFSMYTSKKQFCGIGSLKTNIGHLLAAAGLAGLIKMILALKNQQIPPTLNFEQPNYTINFEQAPVFIVRELMDWSYQEHPRRCGVSAMGFSGTNSHILLEEAPRINNNKIADQYYVVTISAEDKKNLMELLKRFYTFLNMHYIIDIGDISYTSNMGRKHDDYRVAIILKNTDELVEKIELLLMNDLKQMNHPDIYFGISKCGKKTKIGQGENIISKKEKREYSNNADELLENYLFQNRKEQLEEVCNFYVKGADISWNKLHEGKNRKIESIPITPLEKIKCWIKTSQYTSDSDRVKLEYNPFWRLR